MWNSKLVPTEIPRGEIRYYPIPSSVSVTSPSRTVEIERSNSQVQCRVKQTAKNYPLIIDAN